MEKYLTKENIVIIALVFYVLLQSNLFATKLDVANLKLELQKYSDQKDEQILKKLDEKYEVIIEKLDKLRK